MCGSEIKINVFVCLLGFFFGQRKAFLTCFSLITANQMIRTIFLCDVHSNTALLYSKTWMFMGILLFSYFCTKIYIVGICSTVSTRRF